MDESKLRNQQERGHRAQSALEYIKKTFDAIEQDCYETFRRSDLHDANGHKSIRIYLKVMDDVLNRVRTDIANGDAARKELLKVKDPSKVSRMLRRA